MSLLEHSFESWPGCGVSWARRQVIEERVFLEVSTRRHFCLAIIVLVVFLVVIITWLSEGEHHHEGASSLAVI